MVLRLKKRKLLVKEIDKELTSQDEFERKIQIEEELKLISLINPELSLGEKLDKLFKSRNKMKQQKTIRRYD